MIRFATILYWLRSQTVRNACAAHKHYQRQLQAQKDILSADAMAAIQAKLEELHHAIRSRRADAMNLQIGELRAVATQHLRSCSSPGAREVMEIFLVAFAVALSVRTFFLQPFKIPSGSMQPTLYGVNTLPDFADALADLEAIAVARANGQPVRPRFAARTAEKFAEQEQIQKTLLIPTGWKRCKEWFQGISYLHFVAPADGRIEQVAPPWPAAVLSLCQRIKFAGQWHTLWFPPEYGDSDLIHRAGLQFDRTYHQGEDVIKLRVAAGDHLLVDRLSYNFVKPQRGDIVEFSTTGTLIHDPGQFYIKRLVALPGELVQIGDDRHLIINGDRQADATPRFEKIYSFDPDQPPQDDQYSGYLNGTVDRQFRLFRRLSPLFQTEDTIYTNGPGSYLVMGDNTCNSSDSRTWGGIPTENVIGKSFCVYWPLSSRFGFDGY